MFSWQRDNHLIMPISNAEIISNKAKATVAPYRYSIAFFVPQLCTVDKITLFVGPGVKLIITEAIEEVKVVLFQQLMITQYIKKDVRFMRTAPFAGFSCYLTSYSFNAYRILCRQLPHTPGLRFNHFIEAGFFVVDLFIKLAGDFPG